MNLSLWQLNLSHFHQVLLPWQWNWTPLQKNITCLLNFAQEFIMVKLTTKKSIVHQIFAMEDST